MTKKTIEEKIQDVGFWTFGGVIWYLIIAFFLKSKYPIYEYRFNPKDAYDVLKDALTLAATFLAPVAAFVLFSDWRSEHIEKKIESDSEAIVNELNSIFLKLCDVRMSICTEKTLSEDGALGINKVNDLLIAELLIVGTNIQRLKGEGEDVVEFKKLAKALRDVLNLIRERFFAIQNQYNTLSLRKKPYDYLTKIAEVSILLDQNLKTVEKLSEQCAKLQIK